MDKKDNEKLFWNFAETPVNQRLAENQKEIDLYVYGDIVGYDLGEYNWPDDVVANKFKNELMEHADADTIHVRINSNGGNVDAACAILTLLRNHKAYIITYNDGICASAATLIAMAGDKIVSAPYALWMYHLPMYNLRGYYNAPELRKLADTLDVTRDTIVDIMCKRTGLEASEVVEILTNETYISGRDALEKKLVDEITELEVVAYLDEDKQTAFFNGIEHDLSNCKDFDSIKSVAKVQNSKKPENYVAQVKESEEKEENILNLAELKEKYPDIYDAAVQEGIMAENARIKGIEDIALPGSDVLASRAKFDEPLTPEQFAIAMVREQKNQGMVNLKKMEEDAKQLDGVPSTQMNGSSDSEINSSRIKELTAKALKGLR